MAVQVEDALSPNYFGVGVFWGKCSLAGRPYIGFDCLSLIGGAS